MRHNRGIEQGRRFECILAGEERADEELACFGNRFAVWDMGSHFFKMPQPTLIEIDMSLAEIRSELARAAVSVSCSLSASARAMICSTRVAIDRDKGTHHHALVVRPKKRCPSDEVSSNFMTWDL